jgi:hypothetical protein
LDHDFLDAISPISLSSLFGGFYINFKAFFH